VAATPARTPARGALAAGAMRTPAAAMSSRKPMSALARRHG
jgi:hypothetical protein